MHAVCVSRSVVSDSATPCTVARQAPLSMGFSRPEYSVGCNALIPGIFPTQGLKRGLLHHRQILLLSPQGGFKNTCWKTTKALDSFFPNSKQSKMARRTSDSPAACTHPFPLLMRVSHRSQVPGACSSWPCRTVTVSLGDFQTERA